MLPLLRLAPALLLALLTSTPAQAAPESCPAGTHRLCLGTCICSPLSAEDIGPLYQELRELAATQLLEWLQQAHASAEASRPAPQPIPLHMRARLQEHFDAQVLESVRYRLGDDQDFTAANAMLHNPDVRAVTLLDIIVFRHPEDAANNTALWAHELKHVEQYLQWGAEGFARHYSQDFNSVEKPAYELQFRIERLQRQQASGDGRQ